MHPTRRSVLARSGAAAVAALTGFPAILPRAALGNTTWGEVPSGLMPAGFTPSRILEIHCYGAPSIWENFWVRGPSSNPDWRGFDAEMAATDWLCPATASERPTSEGVVSFGQDSLGNDIFWGPATRPLWDSGIMDRTRMVVQKHDSPAIPIHEAAIPYAITGSRLGTPRHAGMGAAFQHRGMTLDPGRTIPHAYVLSPNNIAQFGMTDTAALATGTHPGGSRPLMVKIGGASDLEARLSRPGLSPARDDLLDALRGQYRDRLRRHGAMVPPVRSAQFTAYDAAVESLYNAPGLVSLFSGGVLDVDTMPYCLKQAGDADPADVANRPATAIDLARRLLTDPGNPARHVLIADGGVEKIAGGSQPPYDTHASVVSSAFEQVRATNANLFNMLYHLSQAIDPTGTDPTRINLDDTMIVINAEFGRTPRRTSYQGNDRGREHWPAGYVAILIGGPITSRAIVGGMTSNPGDSSDGTAPDGAWYKPTDIRGTLLMAGGVWPFESELFGTLDFGPQVNIGSETGNAQTIATDILGL
ncbi:DUF1501 domain-containing protein [Roseospira navarrensis]|uniref:DUF1501 domain-containing protein n=1 Tax=Roseospira navarrensis TaxID=140058 RepID=A0A7X1ZFA7_9PROT|nr:DUF1501 domain-containing protein [Roseospira navarrensis]MQX37436.1 DUF1501 domain-containing protein [Roseospira navarrensis]